MPLYARADIRETRLVKLTTETIEVHCQLASGEYRQTLRSKRGETLRSEAIAGLELAAADVLG